MTFASESSPGTGRNEQDADAWYNKGVQLLDSGSSEEAIKCFDKALEINPRNADAWYNKGCSFYVPGRFDEAIECCDKAWKSTQTTQTLGQKEQRLKTNLVVNRMLLGLIARSLNWHPLNTTR